MERVALIGENSIHYVRKLLEAWQKNECVILFDRNIPRTAAIELMRKIGVSKCYIEDKISKKWNFGCLKDISFEIYSVDEGWGYLPEELYLQFRPNYSNQDAIVIFSSGTTGESKGIVLSHNAINTNADSIIKYMDLSKNDSFLIVKPFNHSSTLVGELLVALKTGVKAFVAPIEVPPRIILDNLNKTSSTILCLNPKLLEMLFIEYSHNQSKYDGLALRKMYVSGSILNCDLLQKARNLFSKCKIMNMYGLTEAGPRVSVQKEALLHDNSVGFPIDGVEIKILDELGGEVGKGERGIIHVRTNSCFSGYLIGKQKHSSLKPGWMNTGDVGYLGSNDELYVVGRIDDVIVVNSHKIYPVDVENVIITMTSIKECVVIKSKKYFGQMVCFYTGVPLDSSTIISQISPKLLPYEVPKLYFNVNKLAYNSNGKISRKIENYEFVQKDEAFHH